MDKYIFLFLNTIYMWILVSPVHLKNLGKEVDIDQNNGPPSYDSYSNYDYGDDGIPGIIKNYIYEPEIDGAFEITQEELTSELKKWFSESVSEIQCPVASLIKLDALPEITCEKKQFDEISKNMIKLLNNYENEEAANAILSIVRKSTVGQRMLGFLKIKLSKTESQIIGLIKELWFVNQHLTPGILFPNVFLGFEDHEKDTSENIDYPYNRSSVSWTGNYFMTQQRKEIFSDGKLFPLVDNSMYLADVDVTFDGKHRKSTFIIGTTFLYDFVTFTTCWIVGAKFDKCVVPLPGKIEKMVYIKPVTDSVDRVGDNPSNKVISVFCTGFDVYLHTDSQ